MSLTYKGSGVDTEEGDRLVERIKPHAKRTMRPEVLAGIGGFGGLVRVPIEKYKEPVLVSGTDGVGTKLKVAFATNRHDTIGIDLVAMCVNDVLVSGAEPLYFLDYFATGQLEVGAAEQVIAGIAEGCHRAGCALIGGETAELPGFYAPGEYDLAGFAVGVVDRSKLIDGTKVRPGDRIVGVASNGLHSNGYSLARKVVETAKLGWNDPLPGTDGTVADEFLKPTHIYAKLVLDLLGTIEVKALAHITGGGIPGNLPRPLPNGTRAVVDATKWTMPAVFPTLARLGPVAPDEMALAFNLGIGLCVITDASHVAKTIERANAAGFEAWEIGGIVAHAGDEPDAIVENLGSVLP